MAKEPAIREPIQKGPLGLDWERRHCTSACAVASPSRSRANPAHPADNNHTRRHYACICYEFSTNLETGDRTTGAVGGGLVYVVLPRNDGVLVHLTVDPAGVQHEFLAELKMHNAQPQNDPLQ